MRDPDTFGHSEERGRSGMSCDMEFAAGQKEGNWRVKKFARLYAYKGGGGKYLFAGVYIRADVNPEICRRHGRVAAIGALLAIVLLVLQSHHASAGVSKGGKPVVYVINTKCSRFSNM